MTLFPTRTDIIKLALAAVLTLPATAVTVDAKPKVAVTTKTFTVDATTVDGLLKQLKQKGPKGYWAYTDWYVKWTGSCQTSVDITYTLPKHKNADKLDPVVRKKWLAMVDALTKHEHKHGQNAINAAQEIEKTKCANGNAVIQKWNKADIDLDKRTDHGKKEGVVLK
jgi:predicted secreted Zn-dependent protease